MSFEGSPTPTEFTRAHTQLRFALFSQSDLSINWYSGLDVFAAGSLSVILPASVPTCGNNWFRSLEAFSSLCVQSLQMLEQD